MSLPQSVLFGTPPLLLLLALRPLIAVSANIEVVVFHNNHAKKHFLVEWLPDGDVNQAKWAGEIQPGGTISQDTFKGHAFQVSAVREARIKPATLRIMGSGTILCYIHEGDAMRCEPNWDTSPYRGERWDEHVKKLKEECRETLREHPEEHLHFCDELNYNNWYPGQCSFELSQKVVEQKMQKSLKEEAQRCLAQPNLFRKFTALGHKVTRVPSDLLNRLQAFWEKGRQTESQPENHPKFDATVPGCLSNTWMLHLPQKLKEAVIDQVRPILATWAGLEADDLEFTAIYGLRLYRHGARLNKHIDRRYTHVLSAILEVGHLALGHPDQPEQWPLQINDHNGTQHSEPNQVGNMILYESASCAHGRWLTPFSGRELANVFVHFAPRGWPEGYELKATKPPEL